MADFTGMTVKVTTKGPGSLVLQGKVKQVIPGQLLTLQDVYFLHNGSRCMEYRIQGPSIADLQVVDTSAATPAAAPYPPPSSASPFPRQLRQQQQQQQYTPIPQPAVAPQSSPAPSRVASGATAQRSTSDFVDPAILSYARSPAPLKAVPPAASLPEPVTPIKSLLAKATQSLPQNSSPFVADAGKRTESFNNTNGRDGKGRGGPRETSAQQQVQTREEDGLSRQAGVQPQAPHTGLADSTQDAAASTPKKKARKHQKKKTTPESPLPVIDVEVSRNGNDMDATGTGSASAKRGKGWRQTPLLQPSPQTWSPQTRKNAQKAKELANQNGWATEDATDIQDLGDFDFEANHKLFDKKQVFSDIRQGDTTADEDRLVSHNKLPSTARPGTYGGKNLHPTEAVLSPQLAPLDSSSDADTELNFANGNGRSSSRHSTSRAALKKAPSRQNSTQVDTRPHPLSASMSSDRGGMSKSITSLSGRTGKIVPPIATSPLPEKTNRSPISAISAMKTHLPTLPPSTISEPHFAIRPAMHPCPVLHPSALATLEAETVSRYGLSAEAITESAARSIAETAMAMFQANSRRGSRAQIKTYMRGNTTSSDHHHQPHHPQQQQHPDPIVVIIAGNHTTGARAIAAARHLIPRKTKIIIAEAQFPSSSTASEPQDPQLKTQLAILKRMIKSGVNVKRGTWRKASNHIKNLSGPPDIIIDALLAGETYDSLSPSTTGELAQQETREIIDWANRSRAPVLSIACPAGVSGIDGSAPVLEGEPLAIRPDRVLSLGTPMQGLLDAVKAGERWEVGLVDIGVNIALRSEEAVVFGGEWVVEIDLVEGKAG